MTDTPDKNIATEEVAKALMKHHITADLAWWLADLDAMVARLEARLAIVAKDLYDHTA